MAREVPQLPPGTRGLVRHPALVELSRDHHHVLVQALTLRRAADEPLSDGTTRVAREALAFHADEIRPHSREEEEVLLPCAEAIDGEGCRRIAAEHREMEDLAARITSALDDGGDPRPAMKELGQLLDDHVRYEERGFFENLQRSLDAAALEGLGRRLAEARGTRPRACRTRP
jgi:hemerythrin-like domain-containing protein